MNIEENVLGYVLLNHAPSPETVQQLTALRYSEFETYDDILIMCISHNRALDTLDFTLKETEQSFLIFNEGENVVTVWFPNEMKSCSANQGKYIGEFAKMWEERGTRITVWENDLVKQLYHELGITEEERKQNDSKLKLLNYTSNQILQGSKTR